MSTRQTLSVGLTIAAVQLLMTANAGAGVTPVTPSIIPAPAQIKTGAGCFTLNAATRIVFDSALKDGQELADYCRAELSRSTGLPLETQAIKKPGEEKNALIFALAGSTNEFGQEGYALEVSPRRIIVKAAGAAGCFYGFQTLRQLLPVQIYSTNRVSGVEWKAPAVTVTDQPRFGWRGFMLDVARYYFDKDTLKKLIDGLAVHKLNILHLHLTEHGAWRLAIDKYPGLTSSNVTTAAYYKGPYQPFYTKEDIREIVAYARVRQITIVPEIDMPGHASAAVTAYPEFGTGGLFNPGKEGTYVFLKDILNEVMELFPSPYIHLGGDEVESQRWGNVPEVQALMEKRGLKNVYAVEGYFDRQMTDFIVGKGKIPCGWQEISKFDVNRGFIAFYWIGSRQQEMIKKAVEKGYRVVACPQVPAYFNYGQERGERGHPDPWPAVGIRGVYDWEPVPAQFSENEAKQILGVQACLWTDVFDRDGPDQYKRVEYMTFPRISALAEVAWVPKGTRNDYTEFSQRVDRQIERYRQMGFYYRKPVENIKIGAWSPGKEKSELDPLTVDITPHIQEAQNIGVVFYLEDDPTPWDKIKTVELLENDQVMASSRRHYFTSLERFKNHIYTFDVKTYQKGATYRIRAVARPGQHFEAVVFLRPFVQPETYDDAQGYKWTRWSDNDMIIQNLNSDQPLPPSANMLRNSSFEEDISTPFIDFWPALWPELAVLEETVAKDGKCAVCLNQPIGYARGITYRYVTNIEKGRGYTFSIWAKAEKPDSLLLGFVGPESKHPRGICKMFRVGSDWQRLIWSFSLPADLEAKDNRFQIGLMNPEFYYPEWNTGTLNQPRSMDLGKEEGQIVVSPKNGRIWLDAAQLEVGGTATPYKPSAYGPASK